MSDDDKLTIGCGSISCAGILVGFAAIVFIVAAAIKWVIS